MAQSVGDFAAVPTGTLINDRYKVQSIAGTGNFAKVLKCLDTKTGELVAVKLVKREYARDAAFEKDILKGIASKDPQDAYPVLKMKESFMWNRYPCFVFPLKGANLRSKKLGVTKGNVSKDELRQMAKSMLKALKFLHHDVKMAHTDLKPENILCGLDNAPMEWTIADFGSASFVVEGKEDADLISTRPYRAPEVVLAKQWSQAADIWSMACILFEVFTGNKLFDVHEDSEHLACFEKRLQASMPLHLTKTSKVFRRYFNSNGSLLPGRGVGRSAAIRPISHEMQEAPELMDLITRMLHYDPSQRLTASAALNHPFLAGSGATFAPEAHSIAASFKAPVAAPSVAALPVKKPALSERPASTTNIARNNLPGEKLMTGLISPAVPTSVYSRPNIAPRGPVESPRYGAVPNSQKPAAGVPSGLQYKRSLFNF